MLEWIAMLTMLIDHVGLIFFPDREWFRIIGRIAFPLYCWFLVQGYRHTRNLKKYMWRLFLLACISQIPYTLALGQWELNVIFTLLLGLLALYSIDHIQDEKTKWFFTLGIFIAAVAIPMDYGLYGILLILLFHSFDEGKLILRHFFLNLLFLFAYGVDFGIQLFSILGSILIVLFPSYQPLTKYRWLYRSFYPAHLTILFFVLFIWGLRQ
ncbi:hypothetical protein J2Z37_000001 [Ammoniphilus resinae]|uniref:Conjugal transfer protein TraX n=1 Tax=Ammoniphilus resinae TaxID=861532 RepID=A0ABS4GIE6_9BACL|nr:hypothetical protein [Ammoniphilus resinae]